MQNRKRNHSGIEDGTYNDIEAYSSFNISGMGNVTIKNIGKGAIISKRGMGNLIINGTVGEEVTFKISGMGNVKFSTRPPRSVINKIEKSGMGSIIIPGEYVTNQAPRKIKSIPNADSSDSSDSDSDDTDVHNKNQGSTIRISNIGGTNNAGISIISNNGLVKVTRNGITTTYAGGNTLVRNNQLYIDGSIATDSDPRILHVENAASSRISNLVSNDFGSHSFIRSMLQNREVNVPRVKQNSPLPPQTNALDDYSPSTKAYLNSFKDKEKNTDVLKGLKLSEQEEQLLRNYCDPISLDVIDIPVILNEHLYDLDTLLEIQKKDKLDPLNRYEFTLRDIQPARKDAESLQKIIQQIKEAHQPNQPIYKIHM